MAQAVNKISFIGLAVVAVLLFNGAMAKDILLSLESLNSGEFLENGPYKFIMQADCNLVLYVNQNSAKWNSSTAGKGTSCKVTLQNRGNLVIFSGANTVWTSNPAGVPNSYRLVVQTDGNVVIYGAPVWKTDTVQS